MDELEEARLRSCRAQSLDDAVRDAAATVDGDTRGLVDDHQVLVLMQNRQSLAGERRGSARCAVSRRRRGAHRRDANPIAGGEPGVRPRPPAVHPDFAGPDDPVDMATRHALQDPDEEIVQALAGRLVADLELANRDVA